MTVTTARGALERPVGEQWLDRHAAALMGTYGRPARVLVRGEGAYVWDADGTRYTDLLAGIATTALGHAHPALTGAVTAQLSTLGHVSNLAATPVQVGLAEELLRTCDAPAGSRVFLCNSGAEAIEAAFKITRRTGRTRVLAAEGGFHGRTMGALALTHTAAYREPFEPLPAGVEHVPFGDVDAMAAALADESAGPVAAVVLEPVQGEGGVRPAPAGYLAAVRRLTRQHGALLVLDEVQTGSGRTGRWLAWQHPHHLGDAVAEDPTMRPDVVTLAKGLAGGIPCGAVVAYGAATAGLLGRSQHGTTFGGNPVAAAAALATLHVVERDGLLERARHLGALLRDGIGAVRHPLLAGVRGEGLLLAVTLTRPLAAEVTAAALDAGFVVNAVAPDAVRLAPPLVLTDAQATSFVDALPAVLDTVLPAAQAGPGSQEAPS
ncbi:acetylornithine transaminase [Aquipuribacter hungaricus]|uniref:Acetylornithine transaminase n=1 Tax=Aquipuribacter hungaricus TaxID=545624 RepID=A0ABV7WK75_9MICO